ncbi:MAG: hypothetical protein V2I53_09285 [Paracoccaceae bacterium]|jgi:hypothetical protein|nr:hypothetical protein [Paracoccaceae bacterium]
MTYGTKVATCCYCGTRAALVLRGKERHELSCSSCGAPLHNMKSLRVEAVRDHPVVTPQPERGGPRNRPVTPQIDWSRAAQGKGKIKARPKKRKSTARWLAGEIWDLVEDVFD